MGSFDNFLRIRKEYADRLPEWMAEYEATGDMRQDPYFMDWQFTPIENSVWSDIRSFGLPFFPQVPVLNFFLDFGCPFLKIGIECDGKAWHDSELDKVRDAKLAAAGWMIFRIEGHECNRVVDAWPEFAEEISDRDVSRYFQSTSEGLIAAIKNKYFDDEPTDKYAYEMEATLFEHRSTPETYPKRLPIRRAAGPLILRDCLEGYVERLLLRLGKPAA